MANENEATAAEICTLRLIRLCATPNDSVSHNCFCGSVGQDDIPVYQHIKSLRKKGLIKIVNEQIYIT